MGTDRNQGTGASEDTRDATGSLDGALAALAGILERRHVVPGSPAAPIDALEADNEDLPILDQVVVPGHIAPSPRPAPPPAAAPTPPSLPPHADLVKRLVNEAEVIVESCLDEALDRARKEVRTRIRQHLAIVLPEVIEELMARRSEE
jgi:hypothetical protein